MDKKNFKQFISLLVILITFVGFPSHVLAEEITVSVTGNGSNSSNEVHTDVQSTTTVSQSNTADIQNNVDNNANTGNNSANSNNGGTTINTGNVQTQTNITNENVNNNQANITGNGTPSVEAQITNNGNGSQNTVNINSTSNTTSQQSNNAKIVNNPTTNANTGNNSANSNNGDATINTGSILSSQSIVNKNINVSVKKISLSGCNDSCQDSKVKLLIKGNGNNSINVLNFLFENNVKDSSFNYADIFNNPVLNLSTGGNSANGNNGSVTINTGDIKAIVNIENENINGANSEINCDCKTPQPPHDGGDGDGDHNDENNNPPSNGSSGGSSGGGSGSSNGNSVGGTVLGEILPATGNLLMFWLTLASLIMFFAGWYLRFRSGCSPGYVTA